MPHDDSLVSSMAARLAQVEQLNRNLSAKLAQQAQEMAALREENGRLKRPVSTPPEGAAEAGASPEDAEVAALRMERDQLRRRVSELTQVLAEYGLRAVGGAEGPQHAEPSAAVAGAVAPAAQASAQPLWRPQGGQPAAEGGMALDIRVVEARVEALNSILDDRGPAVVAGGRAAHLDEGAMHLPLSFFADGIKLADRAFLPYEQRPAQELLRDLLDGYFPAALKEAHPNGARLRVVDRARHAFKDWLRDLASRDPDLADGGERLRPAIGCAVHAPQDDRSAGERFLSKLPERVLRGGQLCDVRGPVAAKLGLAAGPTAAAGGQAHAVALGNVGAGAEDVSLLDAGRVADAPIAKLQVKLEGGQRVCLTMEPHATIGSLWEALARWRSDHGVPRVDAGGRQCSLRTAFPPRSYDDRGQSLAEAGLTPSATLFVSVAAPQAAPS